MTASPTLLAKADAARTALLAVERVHPGDKSVKVLHARLTELLDQALADGLLPEQQYHTMGGGTNKSDDAQ